MTTPTQSEVAAALDVLRRATGAGKEPTASQLAKMTDAQLDAAGITSEDMFRIAAATGADTIPTSDES